MSSIVKQVGVGIVLHEFHDERGIGAFQVSSIVPESGADLCGQIRVGDIVLAVDGTRVGGRNLIDVAKLFAGPSGTSIAIKIRRPITPADDAAPKSNWLDQQQQGPDLASELRSPDQPADAATAAPAFRTLTVNVPRVDFENKEDRYVSWIKVAEESRAAGTGAGVGWLLDRVAPRGGELLRSWGAQLREHVQQTQMLDTIAQQVAVARQLATSAALPVFTTAGAPGAAGAGAGADPPPRRHVMRMYTCPNHYVIYPPADPPPPEGEEEMAVVVERSTIKVTYLPIAEADRLSCGRAKIEILGILGVSSLQYASYLLVVTKRSHVVTLPQGDVYRVSGSELRVVGNDRNLAEADPRRVIEYRLIQELLGTYEMIFSYDFDITQTQQRLARQGPEVSNMPLHKRYLTREGRFVWNQHVLGPFLGGYASRCLLPVASGFAKAAEVSTPAGVCWLIIIARREWHRVGYRYQSRGIDEQGHASNSVETEQIVVREREGGGGGPRVSSLVIVRGSVPLLWQEADSFMAWKPRPEMEEEGRHVGPCRLHLEALTRSYGCVDILSLIEETEGSSEAKLGHMLNRTITLLQEEYKDIRYHPFDFHKRCGKLSFKDLPLLLQVCHQSALDFGFYLEGVREQSGVFRVNCIDCLDRTNVAQSVIALRGLLVQLSALDLILDDQREACLAANEEERPLPMDWAQHLHQTFKELWGDHGDAISIQYAGTNALKGDLTRTGRRTVGGLWQDGVRSIKRCVQNNFADTHRQQVIDNFQGLTTSPAVAAAAAAAAEAVAAEPEGGADEDSDEISAGEDSPLAAAAAAQSPPAAVTDTAAAVTNSASPPLADGQTV